MNPASGLGGGQDPYRNYNNQAPSSDSASNNNSTADPSTEDQATETSEPLASDTRSSSTTPSTSSTSATQEYSRTLLESTEKDLEKLEDINKSVRDLKLSTEGPHSLDQALEKNQRLKTPVSESKSMILAMLEKLRSFVDRFYESDENESADESPKCAKPTVEQVIQASHLIGIYQEKLDKCEKLERKIASTAARASAIASLSATASKSATATDK